eukprot:GHVN01034689.1.p2 GENE.GHVN01034689.1~~GHVN01034689.1.p2  ORF type:complete len:102 (-),score=21.70 GHVN01034689.1:33-338(-)
MPGVLQVEALAQLGGVLCLQMGEATASGAEPKVNFLFASVNGVKWKQPVVPGDSLVMEMELETYREKLGLVKMKGSGYVNGVMVVDVKEFGFFILSDDKAA